MPGIKTGTAVEEMVVVLANDRNDRNLGLNRKVERALLEGKQGGFGVGSTSALGEDPQRHAILLHLVPSLGNRLDGVLAVLAIDEDGTGQPHWT